MNYKDRVSLSVAALSLAVFLPGFASAQSSQDAANAPSQAAQEQAAQMVPAQAYLLHKLDAKDMKPGSQFIARLSETVQLKNGPELPKGTELIGIVSTDDMQLRGTSKLALQIVEARLKDGKIVPVRAIIVGVYAPETETAGGYVVAPGEEEANDWTNSVLMIDQLDVMGSFDLHSRVDGKNSAVLVSTKKDNVKLSEGSELALAIATQHGEQSGTNAGN